MCNNYRRPFEEYWLQKIYFGVHTTAQKNATCPVVGDPKVFFWGGERVKLLMVGGVPQLEGHLATQQHGTVCDHSSKTSCPVSLWVILHSLQEAGQQHWEDGEPWGRGREGGQRRQAGVCVCECGELSWGWAMGDGLSLVIKLSLERKVHKRDSV